MLITLYKEPGRPYHHRLLKQIDIDKDTGMLLLPDNIAKYFAKEFVENLLWISGQITEAAIQIDFDPTQCNPFAVSEEKDLADKTPTILYLAYISQGKLYRVTAKNTQAACYWNSASSFRYVTIIETCSRSVSKLILPMNTLDKNDCLSYCFANHNCKIPITRLKHKRLINLSNAPSLNQKYPLLPMTNFPEPKLAQYAVVPA